MASVVPNAEYGLSHFCVLLINLFPHSVVEVQRGQIIHLRSHSYRAAEQGLAPRIHTPNEFSRNCPPISAFQALTEQLRLKQCFRDVRRKECESLLGKVDRGPSWQLVSGQGDLRERPRRLLRGKEPVCWNHCGSSLLGEQNPCPRGGSVMRLALRGCGHTFYR